MKEKPIAILICIFIALSILGFAYAQWNDIITISNTMEFGHLTLRFVDPLTYWDNDDATKDVGKIDCYYTNPDPKEGYETLNVAITNAYPEYEAYCNFTLKNIENLAEHITDVVITHTTGLKVGENYTDTNGNPVGWRFDDALTNEPALYVYVYNYTGMSLVCNTLWSGDDPTTTDIIEPNTLEAQMVVRIVETAQECQTYGFQVEIAYEQVIP